MTRACLALVAFLVAVPAFAQQSVSGSQGSAQDHSQTRGASDGRISASEIFSRARSSVVVILATDEATDDGAQGSGFIVRRNAVVTNHHVVEGMKQAYVVFSDGKVAPVSGVLADSPDGDLILLAVDTGSRAPLPLGDDLSLQQGDVVYALGAPKGLELSLTNGIVSSFRNSNGQFRIQNTAPISHGSSGGPLFDEMGRVVGITTSLLADTPGIYFSIGIDDLKRLVRTPDAVTLTFDEWAEQGQSKSSSGSADAGAANEAAGNSETEQIETLLQDKKFDDARTALRSFATKNPGDPVVDRLTGELDLRTGDFEDALRELDASVKATPKDSIAHYYYAIALFEAQRFPDALAEEETSNSLQPTSSDQPLLAELYYANQDYAQAESMARATLSSNPSEQTALDVLTGIVMHGESSYVRVKDSGGKTWDLPQNNLDAAKERDPSIQVVDAQDTLSQYVLQLSKIDADDFWVDLSIGYADLGQKNYDQAVASFQAAEKSDFPDSSPYVALESFYSDRMEMGQANDQIEAGLATVPHDSGLLDLGVYVSLITRNDTEAARRFNELEQFYPNSRDALWSGCLYYYGTQQSANALSVCARLTEQYPNDHTAHSNYGWAALDANNFQLAITEFGKAYDLASPNWSQLTTVQVVDLLWGFTIAEYYSGKTKEAHDLLKIIRKNEPTAATVTGLQQMPLLWSQTTMDRIEAVLSKYPK